MKYDPNKTVIIVVDGGVVQGYGPSDIKHVILDFDNLKDGETTVPDEPYDFDAPSDSEVATGAIEDAEERASRNSSEDSNICECGTPKKRFMKEVGKNLEEVYGCPKCDS